MSEAVDKGPEATARTLIAMILDRSGSMQNVRDDTVGGFNAFVEEQRALPGEATLLLVQFDDAYEVVVDNLPLRDVPPLTHATFVPRGSTALLDAIGRTLNEIEARVTALAPEARPKRVIVVVLTDGHENASREFTLDMVRRLITDHRARDGWEVLFLGTTEKAIEESQAYGVDQSSTARFAATGVGTRDAFRRTSTSLAVARRTGERSTFDSQAGGENDPKKKMH
jgi:hypothetical protein